ncbi:ABC transporter permease [Thermomicrobium sp. CFH 73360]|uniref:ABC transporter permease n=1 Tax=Thermomicrobium sp. CFH 73360 TaxID=2951987 RepID=UPI0020770EFD|nr:ABC transporter permease [Thermomicrobium sp. CFH 73360]
MDILTLLLLAKLFDGLCFPGSFLSSALVALLLASLPFSALGFAITALVPTARTALVIALVVSYFTLFLTGTMRPRELLPARLGDPPVKLPPSLLVTLFRDA